MKKVNRFGMECELAGAEQYIYMLKNELKSRRKPDYAKLIEYSKHIETAGNFCYFTLEAMRRSQTKQVNG